MSDKRAINYIKTNIHFYNSLHLKDLNSKVFWTFNQVLIPDLILL